MSNKKSLDQILGELACGNLDTSFEEMAEVSGDYIREQLKKKDEAMEKTRIIEKYQLQPVEESEVVVGLRGRNTTDSVLLITNQRTKRMKIKKEIAPGGGFELTQNRFLHLNDEEIIVEVKNNYDIKLIPYKEVK